MPATVRRSLIVALLVASLGAGGLAVPPAAANGGGPLVLVDVEAGSYYEPAVAWMLHEGLTTGVGGRAEFMPSRPVTRAEVVTFLWRMRGSAPAPPSRFEDVPEGLWFSTAVGWARAERLTTGVGGSNRFAPNLGVTRAEVVTFLWRMRGSAPAPASRFEDVPEGLWFSTAVGWARAEGLTTGVGGSNRFAPNLGVTRAEVVTFLWRMRGSAPAPASRFEDVPEGLWFSTAVGWARAEGLTTGVGGSNRFAPDLGVTRAEVATFLWRLQGSPRVPPPAIPPFAFESRSIDGQLATRMSSSWRSGCPVPLSDLRYLTVRHWGFDGRPADGEMVVHAQVVPAVRTIFERLYRDRFPIERMRLIDDYGGDDDRSMAANNTSAFNCRRVTGGSAWSEHAYGRAIDVNPVQNPYVSGSQVLPAAGAAHLDRTHPELGKIREGDAFVRAVDSVGWGWGGRWERVKDYQHISSTGR